MPRIFYVHWNKDEAAPTVRALRDWGFTVAHHWDTETGADTWRKFKAHPPDLLLVSLARLPSHGRRVAMVTRETKKHRHIPVVFLDGEPDKVAAAEQQFPDATFTTAGRLKATLARLTPATK